MPYAHVARQRGIFSPGRIDAEVGVCVLVVDSSSPLIRPCTFVATPRCCHAGPFTAVRVGELGLILAHIASHEPHAAGRGPSSIRDRMALLST
jgi:hypothetical protein